MVSGEVVERLLDKVSPMQVGQERAEARARLLETLIASWELEDVS